MNPEDPNAPVNKQVLYSLVKLINVIAELYFNILLNKNLKEYKAIIKDK
jgi:hypothetical protein